jgi:AcrR family transcriptional regulator
MAPALSTRAPLDEAAWIEAALATLARDGVAGVRVERLAAALGVTKGSFYWHFKDREALVESMLAVWAEGRMAAIERQTLAASDAAHARRKLARLLDIYLRAPNPRGLAVELAIRGLARTHKGAAQAIARVDARRLARVAALLAATGAPKEAAEARALLFYAFLFGQSLLGGGKRLDAARRAAAAIVKA